MSRFEGFQTNSQKTAIPNVFFTQLMPLIKDASELKIALHVFWSVQQKRGSPRFVTFRELLGDKTLAPGLGEGIAERVETLEVGLRGAVEKGILISREVEVEGIRQKLYALNMESERRALERIGSQDLEPEKGPLGVMDGGGEARVNTFALYENNIGPLTPIIVDELKRAVSLYSEEWVLDAIHEAARNSARSWTYIESILKSRKAEGRAVTPADLSGLVELYRKNIGKATPIIRDELKQAATIYPEEWIADAIREAVRNSAPSWAYIDTILKNWRAEGRGSGETGRHTGSTQDTEKYFKGRYGHLVEGRFD